MRHWDDQLDVAHQTLDADALEAMSDPTCKTCASYIDEIRVMAAKDQRLSGGEFTLVDVALDDELPVALVSYCVGPFQVSSAPDASSSPGPATRSRTSPTCS